MRFFALLLGCLLFCQSLWAQEKYWVYFSDKSITEQDVVALSPAALQRRAAQGVPLDSKDYPVSTSYMDGVAVHASTTGHSSRWFNAQVAWLTDRQKAAVAALPYVKSIKPVKGLARISALEAITFCQENTNSDAHLTQLQMIGADQLHQGGLKGEGVLIAVFDNGFRGVDTLDAFHQVFEQERMLPARDFVDGDEDVFAACSHCRHGTWIFSILAAQTENGFRGAAPQAKYVLLRTENDNSETPQEEDNWVAAAEYADSLGAAIFTTSLGYSNFDGSAHDYSRADLNGDIATITRAADIAAQKGIVVINSAGNRGADGITAPADGDSVLAIGSVNACEDLSGFSSLGPSASGQIKPDLAAMGEKTFILTPSGRLAQANGTSLSAPLVAGLAALVVQQYPDRPGWEIADALRMTADQALFPDSRKGYGIPDGVRAIQYLAQGSSTSSMLATPNPASGAFRIYLPREIWSPSIELVDATGRAVSATVRNLSARNYEVLPAVGLATGVYLVLVRDPVSKQIVYSTKIVLQPAR
ncbi:MAG: S8 family peptidase [Bacteroidota bacterium]